MRKKISNPENISRLLKASIIMTKEKEINNSLIPEVNEPNHQDTTNKKLDLALEELKNFD